MIDVITKVSNKPEFLAALSGSSNKHVYLNEEGDPKIRLTKVPTKTSGDHSVSMLRIDSLDELEGLGLEVLAWCETGSGNVHDLIAADPDLTAKVEQVIDRTPIEKINLDGESVGFYTPYLNFGNLDL